MHKHWLLHPVYLCWEPFLYSYGTWEIKCNACELCAKWIEDAGNNRPWKDPATTAAKYSLSLGRQLKTVLKSLEAWSLKNTWNSGILDSGRCNLQLILVIHDFDNILHGCEGIWPHGTSQICKANGICCRTELFYVKLGQNFIFNFFLHTFGSYFLLKRWQIWMAS